MVALVAGTYSTLYELRGRNYNQHAMSKITGERATTTIQLNKMCGIFGRYIGDDGQNGYFAKICGKKKQIVNWKCLWYNWLWLNVHLISFIQNYISFFRSQSMEFGIRYYGNASCIIYTISLHCCYCCCCSRLVCCSLWWLSGHNVTEWYAFFPRCTFVRIVMFCDRVQSSFSIEQLSWLVGFKLYSESIG